MTEVALKQTIILSWGELEGLQMTEPEYILKGLIRGEVGMLQAVTNVGKTTLALNLSICLATGRPYNGLVEAGQPRKILYLDYETPLTATKLDLETMQQALTEVECALFRQNFFIYNFQNPDSEDLILTEEGKTEFLAGLIRKTQADLVIIDPISLAFPGVDEQSNADVMNKIMRPLQALPKTCGSPSILFLHHIGKEKSEEGAKSGRNEAYRSRGASSFATLSRLILQLDRRISGHLAETHLSFIKSKMANEPRPMVIELDGESRWFTVVRTTDEEAETPIQAVVRAVRELDGEAKRAEILIKAGGAVSLSTLDRYLAKAVELGELVKPPGTFGVYHLPNLVEEAEAVNG